MFIKRSNRPYGEIFIIYLETYECTNFFCFKSETAVTFNGIFSIFPVMKLHAMSDNTLEHKITDTVCQCTVAHSCFFDFIIGSNEVIITREIDRWCHLFQLFKLHFKASSIDLIPFMLESESDGFTLPPTSDAKVCFILCVNNHSAVSSILRNVSMKHSTSSCYSMHKHATN